MKLLVTGSVSWTKEQLGAFGQLGHDVTFIQDERIPLRDQGIKAGEYEGVICNGLFLYNDINEFNKLVYIQLTSAGFDRVPMDEIERRKIEIHNARGVYSAPMAEFALTGVLELYKQSRFFLENQRKHEWMKHRGILELQGKRVLILGCGSVGTECAKRFRAMGCATVGVDIFVRDDENYDMMMGLDKLDEMLGECDITVITLPLTETTRKMMNGSRFANMKKGAVLVNIGRGAIVDTKALVEVLESGRIAGAVLDVFENEPLGESRLWDMENVILTPHNSFIGEGNQERMFETALSNLRNGR